MVDVHAKNKAGSAALDIARELQMFEILVTWLKERAKECFGGIRGSEGQSEAN
jgi:hypothetical protein